MAYRDNIDKLARRITDRIPAKVKNYPKRILNMSV